MTPQTENVPQRGLRGRSAELRAQGSGHSRTRKRMLAGLPLEERRLDVNGTDTSVLMGGNGPPLLLLHGGIECGGAYWAPVMAALAARYRLIVPDAPGLGESAHVAQLDAAAFEGWFAALLSATCAEQPALIAHSLLGTFAARFAAQHGDSLQKFVIYGAPGVGPYRMPLGLLIAAVRFDLRPTARNKERFERYALLDHTCTRRRDAGWFDAFSSYSLSRALVPHVKRTMRQLIKVGTREIPLAELSRIQVPTALLWGGHDRMVPLQLARDASARLGWPLLVIEDAAHVPHVEQPDAFVAAIEEC